MIKVGILTLSILDDTEKTPTYLNKIVVMIMDT